MCRRCSLHTLHNFVLEAVLQARWRITNFFDLFCCDCFFCVLWHFFLFSSEASDHFGMMDHIRPTHDGPMDDGRKNVPTWSSQTTFSTTSGPLLSLKLFELVFSDTQIKTKQPQRQFITITTTAHHQHTTTSDVTTLITTASWLKPTDHQHRHQHQQHCASREYRLLALLFFAMSITTTYTNQTHLWFDEMENNRWCICHSETRRPSLFTNDEEVKLKQWILTYRIVVSPSVGFAAFKWRYWCSRPSEKWRRRKYASQAWLLDGGKDSKVATQNWRITELRGEAMVYNRVKHL